MQRIELATDEFYHIYNRGTDKRDIFLGPRDYLRFLALMYLCNGSKAVDLKLQGSTLYEMLGTDRGEALLEIGAYCLMPNHFHLIVRGTVEGGISKFMQKLTTGYTMYFNKLNERTGSLFEGRFKARHANNDRYLSYLISYVHLNPVKLLEPKWKENGITDRDSAEQYLKKYRYSSYLDYLGEQRPENKILKMNSLPEYFETPKDFETTIRFWLEGDPLQG